MKKNIENISDGAISQLADIGRLRRQYREQFKITANVAAQTASISRVTLHRIESGEYTESVEICFFSPRLSCNPPIFH